MTDNLATSRTGAARQHLLELLLAENGLDAGVGKIRPRANQQEFPLSFAQARIWFLDQLTPDSAAYNVSAGIRLQGILNTPALKQSYAHLLERHECLRGSISSVDGRPVQVILPADRFELAVVDLAELPVSQRTNAQRKAAEVHSGRRIALTHGPLIRVTLLRIQPREHVLLICVHHITADARSMEIIMRELRDGYVAFAAKKKPAFRPLPIQYADYADWERRILQGKRLNELTRFWRKQLAEFPGVAELPKDRSSDGRQLLTAGMVSRAVPESIAGKLFAFCRKERITPFVTLLSAFSVLLQRYTGKDDFVVGTSITQRDRRELEDMVGLLMNNLPVRLRTSSAVSFRGLLRKVRHSCVAMHAHKELPFDYLIRCLREGQPAGQLIFQVMFELEQATTVPEIPGLRLTLAPIETSTAKVDLDVIISMRAQGVSVSVSYGAGCFDQATISRLTLHFETLLETALDRPNDRISDLEILTSTEREQIIAYGVGTQCAEGACHIWRLFDAMASAQPDFVAIRCGEDRITYGELRVLASQTAQELLQCGVSPERSVAVVADRGIGFWAAVLGVLGAGAVYVPINPRLPQLRLTSMLVSCRCAAAIVEDQCSSDLQDSIKEVLRAHPMPVLPLRQSTPHNFPSVTHRPVFDPAGIAYAIFTSGSTGLPKLAMVEHRGLLNHLQAKIETLGICSADIVAQNASQSFDISIWQVLAPLISGATVDVLDDETSRDPVRIVDHIRNCSVTILELVPALATLVLDELQKEANQGTGRLRCLMVTGEPVPADFCRKWVMAYPDIRLINAYGPTECSDDVTHSMIETPPENDSTSTPIGRAIRNTKLYVLDSSFNLVPLSVPGELCVGGSAVGRGYHDHPALTAERFIPDRFDGGTGRRMYRTGDRAMWLEGGVLHLLGRKDHQLKLRGFRIEPGEIEAQLNNHPAVRGSVATLREGGAGYNSLVAYIVPREPGRPSAEDLQRFLGRQLPEYMVPSVFVFLSEFPLMVSGKVDRQALQGSTYDPRPCSSGEPPRTAVEELLAGIWCRVLGCGQVSREDDFFRSGGHSLLATQVVSRVRQVFHVELPVALLFQAPTLAKLAEKIEIARGSRRECESPELTRTTRDADLPLSYAQQRLWFVERWLPGTGLYNMPFSVRLQGDLKESALEGALQRIVDRHESLRTTFAIRSGRPVQVIQSRMEQVLSVVDLRHCREEQGTAEVSRLVEDEAERGFDLEKGPLFRAKLVRLRSREHVLLFTVHHIVSDEWSMGILAREVGEFYASIVEGREAGLHPLVVQYADYAVWQREWLKGQVFEKQLAYWKRHLAGLPNLRQGPNRRLAPSRGQGGGEELALSEELSARLRELSRSEHVTLFMTLLAGFQTLLALNTGVRDVVVGTDHAGRGHQELEEIIGFFINPLVMRTDLSGNPTFRDVLQRVRSITLDAYANADLPFDRLVQELQPDRDLSGQPLFQAKMVLLNTPQEQLHLPGLTAQSLELPRIRNAKFDLALVIQDSSSKLCGSISYSTERYRATEIARMVSQFSRLLDAVVRRPDIHLDEVDFFSDEERSVLNRNVEIDGLSAGLIYESQ